MKTKTKEVPVHFHASDYISIDNSQIAFERILFRFYTDKSNVQFVNISDRSYFFPPRHVDVYSLLDPIEVDHHHSFSNNALMDKTLNLSFDTHDFIF